MTAASEARRIALMLNDSKWQEIEEEIATALKMARYAGIVERDKALPDELRWYRAFWVGGDTPTREWDSSLWRDQPDGVR